MHSAQQSILGLGENLALPKKAYPYEGIRLPVELAGLVSELGDTRQQLAVSQAICNDLRNSEALLHAEIEHLSQSLANYGQQSAHEKTLVTQLRNDLTVALTMIAGYAVQAEQFDKTMQEVVVTIDMQSGVIFEQNIYILGLRQAIAQGLAS